MKPTLNTLSDAYIVLDDLGLAGLLTGGSIEVQVDELLRALFREKKLQLFISILSGKTEEECGNMGLSEATKEITSFFVASSAELRSLPGLVMAPLTTPSQSKSEA